LSIFRTANYISLFFILIFLFSNLSFAQNDNAKAKNFGGGIFGEWKPWSTKSEDLVSYKYTMRFDDPKSWWDPKTHPENKLHWHQLGNYRITANAYNLGFVKLFCGESGALWVNEYEPQIDAHSGGFGWVIYGDTVLIDRDDMVFENAEWKRTFGTGYFEKNILIDNITFNRKIFAPIEDHPALVSKIKLINNSDQTREFTLIEYWDVNMKLRDDFLLGLGVRDNFRDARVKIVSSKDLRTVKAIPKRKYGTYGGFPKKPVFVDPELPALFVSSPDIAPVKLITNPEVLFKDGLPVKTAKQLTEAGENGHNEKYRPQKEACLALKVKITLGPYEDKTFRFIFGYEKGAPAEKTIEEITNNTLPENSWKETEKYWKQSMPVLDVPNDKFMSRELSWDYYYLMSSFLYDGYYKKHHIPQGGNYFYYSGGNGAMRDYAAFIQTLSYYNPEAAKEILQYSMRSQEIDGRFFYDLEGFGKRYTVPYRPGDLDIWFLWALCEYVYATRDFGFLNEEVPFYPAHKEESATVYEHAKRSLDHLVNIIGTGQNGHIRLRLSDWNDEMMFLTSGNNPIDTVATFFRGESVMNTAMACHVLPMFRDLAKKVGDDATAEKAKKFDQDMRNALKDAWYKDHLIRSYSGLGKAFGKDDKIFLEPQAWALLEDNVLSNEQEKILVETLKNILIDPSDLGMLISTSTTGSLTTRVGEQEEGGIWFAINGPASVALSNHDPNLAWEQVKKNTLAWHAEKYPDLWYGIWSGPDAWNSVYSDRPGETWYMKTPFMNTGPQMYPIQNAHSHCQTMWAIARMAGITPTINGWIVDSRIPMSHYSFDCALYGISVNKSEVTGRVTLPADDEFTIEVVLSDEWKNKNLNVTIDSRKTIFEFNEGIAEFQINAKKRQSLDWKITRL
jgi:Glycosyl hydrolase 36 superfamily, catalytic domain